MADDSELIERTLNITKSCLVPQLNEDFDKETISESDFKEFKFAANENIHILLDILYQNRCLLSDKVYDNQILQIRMNLLLIACEQTEPNPYFYNEEDKILLNSLWKITSEHIEGFEDKVFSQLITFYKESLRNDNWKKQLGLIHGFPLFCKVMFRSKCGLVNEDFLMFVLSVGSKLVSHYEPHFKTIGLKIYKHILEYGNIYQLKEFNIHQVIYSETFPLIQRSNEMDFNLYLYECLYRSLMIDTSKNVSNSKWCKFDDVFSKLLMHFSFENDVKLSKLLIYKLVQLCAIGYDQIELKAFEEIDVKDTQYLLYLKTMCNIPNHRILRWVNKLMEMMTRESVRLLTNVEDSLFYLYIFNIIYIVAIQIVKPSDFNQILEDFTKKFILILLKVTKMFYGNNDIVALIIFLLSTIKEHQSENENLANTLQKLCNHKMLIKCD